MRKETTFKRIEKLAGGLRKDVDGHAPLKSRRFETKEKIARRNPAFNHQDQREKISQYGGGCGPVHTARPLLHIDIFASGGNALDRA
jgi:hypothetical protein